MKTVDFKDLSDEQQKATLDMCMHMIIRTFKLAGVKPPPSALFVFPAPSDAICTSEMDVVDALARVEGWAGRMWKEMARRN